MVPSRSLVRFALQVTVDVGPDPVTNVAGSAVGAAVTTLVVGAILVAVAPEYTVDRMKDVGDDPLNSFFVGFVLVVILGLVTILLAITLVGLVVALPLAVLTYLVWAIGATVAYLAIADRLVGRADGWTKPLLVAAALNGGLVLTGVGGLVSFVVGAAGFGAVVRYHL